MPALEGKEASRDRALSARLCVMNFFQFFIWGAWLFTLGAYWFQNKHWPAVQFGAVYSTMGMAAILTPLLMGLVADRWVSAERLYGLLHLAGAALLLTLPRVDSPSLFFWVMLANALCYMPTLSLSTTIAYNALIDARSDIVTKFPPIRVWGTVGFIAALWMVSLQGLETGAGQFYLASAAAVALGLRSFINPTLPHKPSRDRQISIDQAGAEARAIFSDRKMLVFFIFAMFLGGTMQLTDAYGDTFLHDFADVEAYADTVAVKYPAIVMSISQISEMLFILAIPFCLRRFGIRIVMLTSMVAWTLRFALLAYGDPAAGFWLITASSIVHGVAFDFFNISGSLYVENQAGSSIRASAQGMFVLMTNGLGPIMSSLISGFVIQRFFTNPDRSIQWQCVWLSFAGYALTVALAYCLLFRREFGNTPWRESP